MYTYIEKNFDINLHNIISCIAKHRVTDSELDINSDNSAEN